MKRAVAMTAALLAGCTVGPNYAPPAIQTPPVFRNAPAVGPVQEKAPRAPWWSILGDPALDHLQTIAAGSNLSLEQALARLDQALAGVAAARADGKPVAAAETLAARSRQSLNSGFGILSRYAPLLGTAPGGPDTSGLDRTVNVLNAQIGASWDLDFAGGVARRREAAGATAATAAFALAAARLAVSAELADAYISYREARLRLAKATEIDAATQRRLAIAAARFKLGASSRAQLEAMRAAAAGTASLPPPFSALAEAQRNRIAVLIGRSPSSPMPELERDQDVAEPSEIGGALPGDVLRHRPDVAAAESAVIVANARIGVARSEYYPKVSLSALLGFGSTDATTLLGGDSLFAQTGAALRWRLFDFGRIDAAVRAARGSAREALAGYRGAVLRATEDVETSFARLSAARTVRDALHAEATARAAEDRIARAALRSGQISEDAALEVRTRLLIAQDAEIAARMSSARAAIDARRALGT
jgi:NodT family efflux transporter outer membrane factor (OMF) lipoprotein